MYTDPSGMSKESYLRALKNTQFGNNLIGFAGLGVTLIGLIPGAQPAIPIGLTMMGTTTVAGVGLGFTEGYMTQSARPIVIELAVVATAPIGGRYATKVITGVNSSVNRTLRFYNTSNGRFLKNTVGKLSFGVEKVIESVGSFGVSELAK